MKSLLHWLRDALSETVARSIAFIVIGVQETTGNASLCILYDGDTRIAGEVAKPGASVRGR